jgi:phage-related minor tail protein
MGFFGKLWEGVKSVVSKAVSVVSSSVSTIGRVVGAVAKEFLGIANNDMEKFNRVVEAIENIAKSPRVIIIRENDSVEDIGDRAMRADKKVDEFDSVNEYINYLREKIKATPKEELEMLPPEERLARRAVGSALLSKAISEKKSLEIPVEFWNEAVRLGLSAKEIDKFLDKFKKAGIEPKDFLKYLKRELSIKEESKLDNALIEAYKELEPDADIKAIEEKVVRMQGK